MNRLTLREGPLPGLVLVDRRRFGDDRGFFSRLFCPQELADAGWNGGIAQINHSHTARRGTVRGMHFQRAPHTEMKLVTCLRGEVLDVAVDLRRGSPTFLQWQAVHLSGDGNTALLLPEGFAHGFQTLGDDVELIYCHSQPYVPEADAGLRPDDPRLAISWPLQITELSARDAAHPLITADFEGLVT